MTSFTEAEVRLVMAGMQAEIDRERAARQAAQALLEDRKAALTKAEHSIASLGADARRYRRLRWGGCWPAVFAAADDVEPLTGDRLDAFVDAGLANTPV